MCSAGTVGLNYLCTSYEQVVFGGVCVSVYLSVENLEKYWSEILAQISDTTRL